MTGTFATRGATWEDFCRHLRSAHLCNSHQLATLSIILNEFGNVFGQKKGGPLCCKVLCKYTTKIYRQIKVHFSHHQLKFKYVLLILLHFAAKRKS